VWGKRRGNSGCQRLRCHSAQPRVNLLTNCCGGCRRKAPKPETGDAKGNSPCRVSRAPPGRQNQSQIREKYPAQDGDWEKERGVPARPRTIDTDNRIGPTYRIG
jgi:hypothetical protein